MVGCVVYLHLDVPLVYAETQDDGMTGWYRLRCVELAESVEEIAVLAMLRRVLQ